MSFTLQVRAPAHTLRTTDPAVKRLDQQSHLAEAFFFPRPADRRPTPSLRHERTKRHESGSLLLGNGQSAAGRLRPRWTPAPRLPLGAHGDRRGDSAYQVSDPALRKQPGSGRTVEEFDMDNATRARFLCRTEKTPACWNWLGTVDQKGYGLFWTEGAQRRAHRVAYQLWVGAIPAGRLVDHICRTNRVGIRGVSRNGPMRDQFIARVRHNGVLHREGPFATPEEAGEAAALMRLRLFTHNEADRS